MGPTTTNHSSNQKFKKECKASLNERNDDDRTVLLLLLAHLLTGRERETYITLILVGTVDWQLVFLQLLGIPPCILLLILGISPCILFMKLL